MYYKQHPEHFYKPNKPDLHDYNRKMEESYDNTFSKVRDQVQSKSKFRTGVMFERYSDIHSGKQTISQVS